MKRFHAGIVFALPALLLSTFFLFCAMRAGAAPQHGFSVKQYEEFHDVLHPLEHEALPKKDYRRIRANSALLVKRGQAIVKLGMPAVMADDQKKEFTKCLNTFRKALARFKTDARKGSNARLKNSYTAVHDSFEILASTLPRTTSGGPPPGVYLTCPSGTSTEGDQVSLSADYHYSEAAVITWTVSAGRIVAGQSTHTIAVDTSGLAGKTIKATAEVNDGLGHLVTATCEVQVPAA